MPPDIKALLAIAAFAAITVGVAVVEARLEAD